MKLSDKQIRQRLEREAGAVTQAEGFQRERHVKETIRRSMNALYESEAERTLSKLEFLYQQGRYIHKYLWLLQGAVLLVLWNILKVLGSGYYCQRCMGIGASLFAILLLP